MPRKRKSETQEAAILAPVPVEVLDQFVREGPLTARDAREARRGGFAAPVQWAPWPCTR